MIENKHPALFQFFGSYFHQDWPEEFDTPDIPIETYIETEPKDTQNLAGKELSEILSLNVSEDELNSLLNQLGCYYEPREDGVALSDWLNKIRKKIALQ